MNYLAQNSQNMKTIFLPVLLLSFISATAQNSFAQSDGDNPKDIDLHIGEGSGDGSKYFNKDSQGRALSFQYIEFGAASSLNNYFDTTSNMVSGAFEPYNMAIGLDNITNNGKHHDIISSLGFLIPQKISAGTGDSLQMRISGWHYTMSALGYDIIGGETVTLAIGPSWTWGNFKGRRTVQGQKTKYTNPFIGPGARAEFRITLGSFMIGGRATYRYDLTHGLWKRKDNLMPVMPEYKNHGLAYFGYLGLIF